MKKLCLLTAIQKVLQRRLENAMNPFQNRNGKIDQRYMAGQNRLEI